MCSILRGALALAALLLLVESRGEASAGPAVPFSYGAQQIALLAGGGFGLRMFGNRGPNAGINALMVRIGATFFL